MTPSPPTIDRPAERAAGAVAILAGVLVLVHAATWDAVRYHDGSFIVDVADLVTVGTGRAGLFRLSLLADMLGSYLLLVPAAVALRARLALRSPLWGDLTTLAGVAYGILGAAAAAAFAGAGEPLIREHAATGSDQSATAFAAIADIAVTTWQVPGAIFGAIWLLGLWAGLRDQWPWYARFVGVLGGLLLAGAAVKMAGVSFDSAAPASPAFGVLGILGLWTGTLLWRSPGVHPEGSSRAQPGRS